MIFVSVNVFYQQSMFAFHAFTAQAGHGWVNRAQESCSCVIILKYGGIVLGYICQEC